MGPRRPLYPGGVPLTGGGTPFILLYHIGASTHPGLGGGSGYLTAKELSGPVKSFRPLGSESGPLSPFMAIIFVLFPFILIMTPLIKSKDRPDFTLGFSEDSYGPVSNADLNFSATEI